jgi:hypothetical protein
VVFDPASGATLMAWIEQSAGQSQSGVYVQRFDSGGNRLWGSEGSEVVPLSAASISVALPVPGTTNREVFWTSGSGGVDQLSGAQLDPTGTIALGPFAVSTAASDKSRLTAATTAHGQSILAWVDDRVDAGDVYAQNARCDGTLGTAVGASYCTAGHSAIGCQATVSGSGTPSATASSGFVVTASSLQGQKNGQFFWSVTGKQASPWGNGTSYRCTLPPNYRGGLLSSGPAGACGGSVSQDLNARWQAKPAQNPGAGTATWLQYWYRDPGNTSNQSTSFSDGLEFTVCP